MNKELNFRKSSQLFIETKHAVEFTESIQFNTDTKQRFNHPSGILKPKGGAMKTILLTMTLGLSQFAYSERICEEYIPDEWPDSRYIVEVKGGDNVVTDRRTELMWKQCSEGLTGLDCTIGSSESIMWEDALALVETHNAVGFAGYTDWRLPNIKELRSLAAINCHENAINETVFPNTPSFYLWSSSPAADDNRSVWIIDFKNGYDNKHRRNYYAPLRLVRSEE